MNGIIKSALDGYARSPAMERAFLIERSRTIGASEIGQCSRRIGWNKSTTPPERDEDPERWDRWGARMRGTIMEDKFWVQAMKRRFRKKLLLSGKNQRTVHDRHLSATLDGLLVDVPRDILAPIGIPDIGESRCILVECKTIDPRVNLTEVKYENMLQTQAGMGLIRELTRYKPEYALVSYMDASFWDEVDEFGVKFDPALYQTMHDRAVKIKTSNPAELKAEGWIAGGKECEHCPWTRACGIVRRSLPEEELAADPQFVAEMRDLCREHEALNSTLKSVQVQVNEKKEEIKTRLREKSVRKLPGIVSWSPVKGRTSLDKEAVAAAGIDLTPYEKTGEPGDQLRVTIPGLPTSLS
jgi:hypothetical protein